MAGKIKSGMVGNRDKLEEMYHGRGMSLTDIGREFGCTRQYVQLIFKNLGIDRRTKQEALRQKPKQSVSKHNFQPDHDDFILRHYSGMTDQMIAEKLGKPASSITYRRLIILRKKKINRRNFSPIENNFIIKNYKKLSDTAMARILDRSLISITHHRNRILNRPKRNIRSYTESENQYIRENYHRLTDSELAANLNRSPASVSIHRNEVLGLLKINRKQYRPPAGSDVV